jgi:hypothetical protein
VITIPVTISDVTDTLQKIIMPYIQDNLPKHTILLDQLKRNAGVTVMNDNFYAPIRASRHGGVANLANDASKLVSGETSFDQAQIGVKILTGAFDISDLTIKATNSDKKAVATQLTVQAESLASDFARNVNRQMWSDGVGVVGEIAGSVSSTVFTIVTPTGSIDDGRTIDNYGSVNGDRNVAEYLAPGMLIGIGTAAAAKGTISSVNAIDSYSGTVHGTITLTGATATAANDAIFILDGDLAGAGTAEITGIRAALSSTTGTSLYATVPRSTVGWAPQFGSVAEALTLSRMESAYLRAKRFSKAGDRYAIFVNLSLYKKYGDLLTSMRRSVDTADLLGGWTGLEFAAGAGKVGVFLDYDVPDGEFYVLNLDTWTICQVGDLGWIDGGTSDMLRRSDYLTYQAVMAWYTNLLCLAPAANAREAQKTA